MNKLDKLELKIDINTLNTKIALEKLERIDSTCKEIKKVIEDIAEIKAALIKYNLIQTHE